MNDLPMGPSSAGTPSHRSGGPIAYLTGEYPKVSHTFIAREIAALRAAGVEVSTCTVRRPNAKEVIGPDQEAEAARTFCILEAARSPRRLFSALFGSFARSPKRWLQALALTWQTRSPGAKSMLWQLFYFVEATLFAEHVRQIGARHIHNHFGDSSCTVAMLSSALSGVPFSFTPHGPAIFFEPRRWRLDEKVARASFVVCISHFARAQMMLFSDQAHWHKLAIVHCGVIPSSYGREPHGPYRKRVLFIGRLAAVKGLPLLLRAVADVRTAHPDLTLTIIGDGLDRERLEAQTESLGLAGIVRFVGYQSQDAVARILESSDILVLPSFAEGVPVVLMEAMASRLPVIATGVAGVLELVEDGVSGFVVPPGDVATLSRRLNQMLAAPKLQARMGRAGRSKIEAEFDIDQEAAKLLTLLAGEELRQAV